MNVMTGQPQDKQFTIQVMSNGLLWTIYAVLLDNPFTFYEDHNFFSPLIVILSMLRKRFLNYSNSGITAW